MKRGTILPTLLAVTCGVLLGWLTASGKLATVFAQEVKPAKPMACDAPGDVLPFPEQEFKGVIERTAKDSTPDFPKAVEAPKVRPNVLLIMTDDVGFGAASTFGGPIPTPTFDKLAKAGLRYNNVPHHGDLLPVAGGAPYRTQPPHLYHRRHHGAGHGLSRLQFADAEKLRHGRGNPQAERLQHVMVRQEPHVPDWQTSQAGPFDLWPTGLGFEYFYGFIGGDTDQWHPALFEGTKPIEAPHDPKLSPRRGPGRPRHRVDSSAALARTGQTVLRLLHSRPVPRAASRAQGMDCEV